MKSVFVRYYDSWYCKNANLSGISWRKLIKYSDGLYLVNEGNGRCNITSTTVILEQIDLEYGVNDNEFEMLDWTNTYLNDPSQESGWLSPEGIFYGCPYGSHISSARLLLKTTERDLEQKGFVKIHSKDNFICRKEMTDIQAKWLIEHHYGR